MNVEFKKEEVKSNVYLFEVLKKSDNVIQPMTYIDLANQLSEDKNDIFRDNLINELNECNFPGYFLEFAPFIPHLPQTHASFVVVKSEGLSAMKTDLLSYKEYIQEARGRDQLTTSFLNLGRDAELLIPVPTNNQIARECCAQIGSFMRSGPNELKHEFLKGFGLILKSRIEEGSQNPLWISTSGMGVSYLHLRFDKRPKYYSYQPFRRKPNQS